MQRQRKKNDRPVKTLKVNGFQLFAREKCHLREFVIAKIFLNSPQAEQIKISRCRTSGNGKFQLEDSFVYSDINYHLKAFHLHNIFLDANFGLQVELPSECGFFELSVSSPTEANPIIIIQSLTGERITPSCFIKSESVS